ncbi:MAG: ACT domain-containing protein [Spirochaetales bacterium]|nr:ACT domain-containing protein [Spirochaetales bacterium]
MAGEEDLNVLLSSMTPVLNPGEFVFVSLEGGIGDYPYLEPLCSFSEKEGLTLIIPVLNADEYSLPYDAVFRYITLEVHSSLEAVGLTAAVSSKLAQDGISANVVAAYYHDHIFVQSELAEKALKSLKELSGSSR